ncbi:hypothetical protein BH11PSE11_BH11PSE11_23090 [soil metagenome]
MNMDSSTQLDSGPGTPSQNDILRRLLFFTQLQGISNKVHATSQIVEIMLDLSKDICELFNCDRLTLYSISEGKELIESKVKTGLNSFKDFTLPISEKSIAGYVALAQRMVNISDVYDETELRACSPELQFLKKVDTRTGYRTVQMLAAPLMNPGTGELVGVIQLINSRDGKRFSAMMEDGLKVFCETLSLAFSQRTKPPLVIRSKYDYLVADGILSSSELASATSSARRSQANIEDVLVDEFKVQAADIGHSLSRFFGVPYEAFLPTRSKPHKLLKNFRQKFVEHNHWLPLEEVSDGLVVLTTDPERIKAAGTVNHLFPKINLIYRVTTQREFQLTLEQILSPGDENAGAVAAANDSDKIGELDQANGVEQDLIERANRVIADAFLRNAPDIKITLLPEHSKVVSRTSDDGSLDQVSGQIVINFRYDLP